LKSDKDEANREKDRSEKLEPKFTAPRTLSFVVCPKLQKPSKDIEEPKRTNCLIESDEPRSHDPKTEMAELKRAKDRSEIEDPIELAPKTERQLPKRPTPRTDSVDARRAKFLRDSAEAILLKSK